MPVFMSHKRQDKSEVLKIAKYLERHNVRCYVDELDPELQTTDDITKTLIKRLEQCSHIMAVVSQYTTLSWWVPFEIGIGTEKDRRITSYQLTSVELPEFLTKWPIMRNQSHLDVFIDAYKRDNSRQKDLSEAKSHYQDITSADMFHRTVKSRISMR